MDYNVNREIGRRAKMGATTRTVDFSVSVVLEFLEDLHWTATR
jgi:hypothetical protein